MATTGETPSFGGATYAIGATGPALARAIEDQGGNAIIVASLEAAIDMACSDAHDGDVLLLSPGCASWDQFTNYIARGDCFAQYLEAVLGPMPHVPDPRA